MSRVTTEFQITIPREVRIAMNIMPGVDVGFKREEGKFYLVKSADFDPIEKWRGALKTTKTTDVIMAELRGYGLESVD